MGEQQRERLAEIVGEAVALGAGERERYVRGACGGDEALVREALSLVGAIERAGGFLNRATMAPGGAWGGTGAFGAGATMGAAATEGSAGGGGEQPGSMVGRYRLLERIGEGGFGVVYMAEQREPVQRRVALKVIKLGMDTAAVVARFEHERQALAMMDHPGIARVLDGGVTEAGRPYFVMELVKGEPIVAHCERAKMGTRARLELFAQVCRAVQHAHTKGVIHRDIKPGNVLVTMVDGRASPKVIDFGIAKATGGRLTERTFFTEFRQMIGTPEYMSPEQAVNSGVDIDARTDIYSLGVLLYELLTGVTPLDAKRLRSAAWGEMQRMIREEEPEKPSTKLRTLARGEGAGGTGGGPLERASAMVRGDIDWIVMRCLEKDRTRRYDTAEALAADLERHLAGQAVEAAPASAAYRARKFVLRHRYLAGGAAATVLALALGAAAAGVGLVAANRERDRARAAEGEQSRLRAAAEASEAKARLEAERSETVAHFLTDMLRGVGPAVAQGRDTTIVREILEKTAARLDAGELKSVPLVEADMRHIVGVVLADLGLEQRAIGMLRDALRLRVAADGEDGAEAGEARNDLAAALWGSGLLEEAEGLMRRNLEIRERLLGPDHPHVAISLNNLGTLLIDRGDLDGAEAMLRRALANRRRSLAADSKEVSTTLSNLAGVLFRRGDLGGAERAVRESVAADRSGGRGRTPDIAKGLNTLGAVLAETGRLEEAEAAFRESLEVSSAILEPDHPFMIVAWECLADCLQDRASAGAAAPAVVEETIGLLRSSLALAQKRTPGDEVALARVRRKLARSLADAGRLDEAEEAGSESAARLLALAARPEGEGYAGPARRAAEAMVRICGMREHAEPGRGHGERAEAWRRRLGALPAEKKP